MEEVCWQWDTREGEVPRGVEEQDLTAEAVHDEGSETRQDDLCFGVSVGSMINGLSVTEQILHCFGYLCDELHLTEWIGFHKSIYEAFLGENQLSINVGEIFSHTTTW